MKLEWWAGDGKEVFVGQQIETMYAKLYAQVVASSLTQNEPIDVRGVFFMLLAMADKSGNVAGTDPAISRIMNVPLEVFLNAAERLQAPDPASQSPEFEGRRIVPLDGTPGYFIVNYAKYSQIANDAQRREYLRVKKAESRARANGEPLEVVPGNGQMPGHVRRGSSNRPKSLDEVITAGQMHGIPEATCRIFYLHYESTAKEDASGEKLWVTGQNGEKVVGQWKSLLQMWWSKEQERGHEKKLRRRDRGEAEKEPEKARSLMNKVYDATNPKQPTGTVQQPQPQAGDGGTAQGPSAG